MLLRIIIETCIQICSAHFCESNRHCRQLHYQHHILFAALPVDHFEKMSEANTDTNEKRSRKQTTFFKAPVEEKKEVTIGEGSGIKLAENPHFCKELESIKADSETCKALHALLYGSAGRKVEIKKNLRNFSGFPGEVSTAELSAKVSGKKKIWTVAQLKTVLGMLGLEKSGDRELLVTRMVEYLAKPAFTKEARPAGSSSGTKRKKATKSASKKGTKKAKKVKKQVAPSAYILFCKDMRPLLKEQQPDLSMIEQTKEMGLQWNALTAEAKEVS
jgi:hypothetical protein